MLRADDGSDLKVIDSDLKVKDSDLKVNVYV